MVDNTKDMKKKNIQIGRKNVLFESKEPEGLSIKGFDFDNVDKMKGIDYDRLLDSYLSTGFQATHFAKALKTIDKMIADNCTIYMGYTSNLVTSGLRDIFRYLAEHKMVDVIVTTAGGIEEDIIKCLGDFIIGDFKVKGKELREKGINRIGNIFVPNSRYCRFEDFIMPILNRFKDRTITSSELIETLGKEINNKESIYYWCWKNKIKVFCPAITDGSLGDMIYFFKMNNKDFKVDVSQDIVELNNSTIGKKKTGVIILGSGVIKHAVLNANMFRNGADYAVYINTEQEYNGSDSGALPDEAVSWGKLKKDCESVKVYADATLVFPIIAAECFAKENFFNRT